MSLGLIKAIYCVAIITIAIILDCNAGWLGWITAIIMLSGALPLFRAIRRTIGNAILTAVECRSRANANSTRSYAEHPQDRDHHDTLTEVPQ